MDMMNMLPCVLCCDCLWKVFIHADKRLWGLQEADVQFQASSIKACMATGFPAILCIQSAAPSSPLALCVSHLQHLTASSFSLNLPHTYRCSRRYLWKNRQRWRKRLPSCSHHLGAREGLPLGQVFHYVSGKQLVRVRRFNLEVTAQI